MEMMSLIKQALGILPHRLLGKQICNLVLAHLKDELSLARCRTEPSFQEYLRVQCQQSTIIQGLYSLLMEE
jgi:hypothetical protein